MSDQYRQSGKGNDDLINIDSGMSPSFGELLFKKFRFNSLVKRFDEPSIKPTVIAFYSTIVAVFKIRVQ